MSRHVYLHAAVMLRLLLASLLLGTPALTYAQGTPQVITSDLVKFYRAVDLAAGRDSAERVRIFEREYLRAGSAGLKDWALVRLASWDEEIMPVLARDGWTMEKVYAAYGAPSSDSSYKRLMSALDSLVPRSAAVSMAAVTAQKRQYFEGIRRQVLALDTAAAIKQAAARGLQALTTLYPQGKLRPVYIVVGRLNSGGTIGESGVLLGAEMATRTAATPVHELTDVQQGMVTDRAIDDWASLIVHESVHTFQRPGERQTLLQAVLHEGVPDFLASLALPTSAITKSAYQRYGRANEARVWREFVQGMQQNESPGNWLYSYSNPTNHGHPDLGYFIGYRIAEAYYVRATDKAAAIRELILLTNAEQILRASGYMGASTGGEP